MQPTDFRNEPLAQRPREATAQHDRVAIHRIVHDVGDEGDRRGVGLNPGVHAGPIKLKPCHEIGDARRFDAMGGQGFAQAGQAWGGRIGQFHDRAKLAGVTMAAAR